MAAVGHTAERGRKGITVGNTVNWRSLSCYAVDGTAAKCGMRQ